jgi:2-dehydro-3-deoxyglucarate aldolase/4-hydroxy-2-oxoheptanedioate aldolase
LAAVKKVGDACKKRKKSSGRLLPDVATGAVLYRQDFDFICYSGDV